MLSSNLNEFCKYWFEVRLLLFSSLISASVSITIAIFIVFDINANFINSSLALTYSVLLSSTFVDCLYYFNLTE
jgi:hypothetical protein